VLKLMLKTISGTVLVCLLLTSVMATAKVNLSEAHICQVATTDDVRMFKAKIKSLRVSLRRAYFGVTCDPSGQFAGGNLLHTAIAHDSVDVALYIVTQLSSVQLAKMDDQGETLKQWITDRYKDYAPAETVLAAIDKRLASK